jgi:hypothetical protein
MGRGGGSSPSLRFVCEPPRGALRPDDAARGSDALPGVDRAAAAPRRTPRRPYPSGCPRSVRVRTCAPAITGSSPRRSAHATRQPPNAGRQAAGGGSGASRPSAGAGAPRGRIAPERCPPLPRCPEGSRAAPAPATPAACAAPD